MKLLILADIDDFQWKHGEGQADVVLSCGDVPDQVILEAAQAYGCALIFAVKGNRDASSTFPEPIVDLHLQVREHDGISFGGMKLGLT
jgi:predicted phosphodiesterase